MTLLYLWLILLMLYNAHAACCTLLHVSWYSRVTEKIVYCAITEYYTLKLLLINHSVQGISLYCGFFNLRMYYSCSCSSKHCLYILLELEYMGKSSSFFVVIHGHSFGCWTDIYSSAYSFPGWCHFLFRWSVKEKSTSFFFCLEWLPNFSVQ